MRSLLATPGVVRFYLADQISTLGDYALWLALGIWVCELTGSTAAAALVVAVYSLGNSLAALLGGLVDRFPRRALLLVAYPATALLLCPLLAVHARGEVWIVYVVMLLYGVSGGLTGTAQTALVPRLLGEGSAAGAASIAPELLAQANGLQQTLRTCLRLLAPALGAGMLVALGGPAVAAMDAGTFIVATVLLASLKLPRTAAAPATPGEPGQPENTERAGVARVSGFHCLRTHPLLGPMTAACAAALFVIGFSNALTFEAATSVLHRSATFVAVLTTLQGAGALLGGPSAAPLLRRFAARGRAGELDLMTAALAGSTLATVLRAIPAQGAVMAGNVLIGMVIPWLLVAAVTAVQGRTPDHLRGRVIAAASLAVGLPQLLGQAAGAGIVTVLPYLDVCLFVAAVLATSAAGLALRARRPVTSQWPDTRGGHALRQAAGSGTPAR